MRIALHLAQENAFRDIEDARARAGDVFQPVLVTDLLAQRAVAFLRHASGEQARRDAAGLQDDDAAVTGQPVIEQELRDLRRFAGTGRRLDDDAAVGPERAREVGAKGLDGKRRRHAKILEMGDGVDEMPEIISQALQPEEPETQHDNAEEAQSPIIKRGRAHQMSNCHSVVLVLRCDCTSPSRRLRG